MAKLLADDTALFAESESELQRVASDFNVKERIKLIKNQVLH